LLINSIEADKFFARYPETLDFGTLRNILCRIYCRIDLTTFIAISNAATAGRWQERIKSLENYYGLFQTVLTMVFLVLIPTAALASDSTSGTVNNILVLGGKVFFFTTGTRTSMPTCQTQGSRWVFNGASAEGQAMLSVLLTAYASNKAILVHGTGACTDWGDTESVEFIVAP
jgi:hypothetical protein